MRRIYIFFAILIGVGFLSAQTTEHIVKPKETLSKIRKKYSSTAKELKELNPQLKLRKPRIGEVLVVPTIKEKKSNKGTNLTFPSKNKNEQWEYIKVQPKETLYSISKKHSTPVEDILKFNPTLNPSKLKIGDEIKLPKPVREESPVDNKILEAEKKINRINIVMFLPFNFKSLNSAQHKMATSFLYGAKMAVDSIAKQGKYLNLDIINIGENSQAKIDKYDFSKTNVIVGPLFKNDLLYVANNESLRSIPIVSPFANGDYLDVFDNVILYETRDKYYLDALINYVIRNYSDGKIHFVIDSKYINEANELKTLLNKQLKKVDITISADTSNINQNDQSNIIIISKDDDLINNLLNKINLDDETTKLYSAFYNNNFEKNEYRSKLKKMNLFYADSKYIDVANANSTKTIEKYKKEHCNNPDKYALMGFDSTYDIISRLNKTGFFSKDNMKSSRDELSNTYSFDKIKSGAWVNKNVKIIKF